MSRAFTEDKLFEQGSLDDFYVSGSSASLSEDVFSFASSLSNKAQVKISFNVTSNSTVLPSSCSIYYFNKDISGWEIPQSVLPDIAGPLDKISIKPPAASPQTSGSWTSEDFVGFDYRGNALSSGSQNIYRQVIGPFYAQRVEDVRADLASTTVLNPDLQAEYMTRDFNKSFQRNPDYSANDSQTFSLPLERPFLIEKVVIEIPFCFGKSWFGDKSTVCLCTSSLGDYTINGTSPGSYATFLVDEGGPALTVSLLSQKKYGTSTIRDIITKSVVTHKEDVNKEVVLKTLYDGIINPFLAYTLHTNGLDPEDVDSVVSPGLNNYYTGSVIVKSTPSISNGVNISFGEGSSAVGYSTTSQGLLSFATDWLSSEYKKPLFTIFSGVDVFGRGSTGFSPSGGSIFGREYSTATEDTQLRDGSFKNPYYIEDSSKRNAILSTMSTSFSTTQKVAIVLGKKFIGTKKDSPYLMYPGEKLILALSKTRPAMSKMKIDFNTTTNPDALTKGISHLVSCSYFNDLAGQNGHDVQFNTGSINITFYGSYIREGNSYRP